jgi:hypothetical protein
MKEREVFFQKLFKKKISSPFIGIHPWRSVVLSPPPPPPPCYLLERKNIA